MIDSLCTHVAPGLYPREHRGNSVGGTRRYCRVLIYGFEEITSRFLKIDPTRARATNLHVLLDPTRAQTTNLHVLLGPTRGRTTNLHVKIDPTRHKMPGSRQRLYSYQNVFYFCIDFKSNASPILLQIGQLIIIQ